MKNKALTLKEFNALYTLEVASTKKAAVIRMTKLIRLIESLRVIRRKSCLNLKRTPMRNSFAL